MEIVTANSLADGIVVFQTTTGWSADIRLAEVLETKEAVAAAMQRANADAALNRVVEPYSVEAAVEGGRIVPTKLRERIRAEGPTTGHSKNAAADIDVKAA